MKPFWSALLLYLLTLAPLAACSDSPTRSQPSPEPVAAVVVTPDTPMIVRDGTVQFSARTLSAAGNTLAVEVRWSTADTSIVTVDGSGLARGISPGLAEVRATAQGRTGTSSVIVLFPPADSSTAHPQAPTTVAIGHGTTVSVPDGGLPEGSTITARRDDGAPVPAYAEPLGPAFIVAVQTPVALSVTDSRSTVQIRVRERIAAPSAGIADQAVLVVEAGEAEMIVPAEAAAVSSNALGQHFVEATFRLPLLLFTPPDAEAREARGAPATTAASIRGEVQLRLSQVRKTCGAEAWSLSLASDPWVDDDRIPLVLVHGIDPRGLSCARAESRTFASGTWLGLVNHVRGTPLADRYQVWLYSYPTLYPIADNARVLTRLLEEKLPGRSVVIVAHSMGGLVASEHMRTSEPDHVAELMTLSTPFRGSPLAESAQSFEWIFRSGAGDLAPTSTFLQDLGRGSDEFGSRLTAYAGTVDWGVTAYGHSKLLKAGGLWMDFERHGPNDGAVPETSARPTYAARSSTLAGLDHDQVLSEPTAFLAVRQRLQTLSTTVPSVARAIEARSGNGQTGTAAQLLPLPVTVRVVDAVGVGVSGASVSFAAAAGSGAASPASVITDAAGVAATRWTLGPAAGPQTLQVSSPGTALQGITLAATATATSPPVDVPLVRPVAGGGALVCAVRSNGGAVCWALNIYGEAGDGTTTRRDYPTPVDGGLAFSALSGAGYTACGLTTAGKAYCWGYGLEGQLGTGRAESSTVPVAVATTLSFTQISTGESSTCALTAAGAAYCWGHGGGGKLGDGSENSSLVPVRVNTSRVFAQITVAADYACGRTAAGEVYCWGWGNPGLGVAAPPDRCSQPSTLQHPCALAPVRSAAGFTFSTISAAWSHTCGIAPSGSTYCWGSTENGVGLGDGTTGQGSSPRLVAGGHAFTSIVTGGHMSCGLTSQGEAYCWGLNHVGQIGDGTWTTRLSPVPVAGGYRFALLHANGGGVTCGVKADGALYCWGGMMYSIGVGNGPNGSLAPVRVGNLVLKLPPAP